MTLPMLFLLGVAFFALPNNSSACYGCPNYDSYYANPYNYYHSYSQYYAYGSQVGYSYYTGSHNYYGYSYISEPKIYNPGIPAYQGYSPFVASPIIYSPSLPYNGGYTSTYYPDYSYSYNYTYPYYMYR